MELSKDNCALSSLVSSHTDLAVSGSNLHDLVSVMVIRLHMRPATATGDMICLSVWKGFKVMVPLAM